MTAPALNTAVPNLTAPAVDPETGLWTQGWRAFFRRFGAGAPPIEAVTVGASPLVWVAPGPGDLVLNGGAGVAASLARGRVTLPVPGSVVPVATGDTVTVAFTGAPSISFVPRTV